MAEIFLHNFVERIRGKFGQRVVKGVFGRGVIEREDLRALATGDDHCIYFAVTNGAERLLASARRSRRRAISRMDRGRGNCRWGVFFARFSLQGAADASQVGRDDRGPTVKKKVAPASGADSAHIRPPCR